ncbi:MAG: hypothetical protein ABI758_00695 [Candidatus Woesebacteria bacterium]
MRNERQHLFDKNLITIIALVLVLAIIGGTSVITGLNHIIKEKALQTATPVYDLTGKLYWINGQCVYPTVGETVEDCVKLSDAPPLYRSRLTGDDCSAVVITTTMSTKWSGNIDTKDETNPFYQPPADLLYPGETIVLVGGNYDGKWIAGQVIRYSLHNTQQESVESTSFNLWVPTAALEILCPKFHL